MPAIDSGKVLVTGASGYIAGWIIKAFLERGFAVRGTVRSDRKGALVKETFKDYNEKVEYVVVEDMARDGAFDEVVKDVDAVVHTATPFHVGSAGDPDELIVPAVAGMTGLLRSAQQFGGARLKRIVVTSSCTAVMGPGKEPRVADENTWNDEAVQDVREHGRDADALNKYRASKTLSERAAWTFYAEHKGELAWDLVVLCPPFVLGPSLYPAKSLEDLNASLNMYYSNVIAGKMSPEVLAATGTSWVDVRDIAEAHALALLKPETGGERIIVSAGPFKWQDLVLAARRLEGDKIPPGNEAYDPSKATHFVQLLTDKERRIFGLRYRTLEEATRDVLVQFKANGWL